MTEHQASKLKHRSYVRDARGRRVKQLDPVALRLLRRGDVIENGVLRAITLEKGVGMSWFEWGGLLLSVTLFFVVIGVIGYDIFKGRFFTGRRLAQLPMFSYYLVWPYIVWWFARRKRFARTAAAMLKYIRCPHCGYDLRMLPTDPRDGATVCPECGCAWRLAEPECPPVNRQGAKGAAVVPRDASATIPR
jgi:hypothetical protein